MLDIRKLKPSVADEVIIVGVSRNTAENSIIKLLSDGQDNNPVQYFDVISKGPKAVGIEVGDRIVCSWHDVTQPIVGLLDGKQVEWGAVKSSKIMGIVEE